jgi:hypothetical protein
MGNLGDVNIQKIKSKAGGEFNWNDEGCGGSDHIQKVKSKAGGEVNINHMCGDGGSQGAGGYNPQ